MRRRNGFTLIELLIVIGIIAVLGGVMLAQFSGSTDSALAASCMNNLRTLCNATLSDASRESRYPAAGPFQYEEKESSEDPDWEPGWIGKGKGGSDVSCYHSANDKDEDQHYAITNGSIWSVIGGKRSAYVCPAHTKYCKKPTTREGRDAKRVVPSWSYAMNCYFGWSIRKSRDVTSAKRYFPASKHGDETGLLFRYKNAPTTRVRSPEKVLLFAEIPYVYIKDAQTPSWDASADSNGSNDMILQYKADTDEGEVAKADMVDASKEECIGFNHRSGKYYSGHVAFADGHCAKLTLPINASKNDLVRLTTWLCTGAEYTFDGTRYNREGK